MISILCCAEECSESCVTLFPLACDRTAVDGTSLIFLEHFVPFWNCLRSSAEILQACRQHALLCFDTGGAERCGVHTHVLVSLCGIQEGIHGGLCYSHSKFTSYNLHTLNVGILTYPLSSTHLASAKSSSTRRARTAQTRLSASSTTSSMMSRARSTTRSTTSLRIWAFT